MVATRTWVTGEVVIADHFNTNIRDVLNFLLPVGDPWVTWTPTLTNLTLGNGTVIAKHRVVGKTLDYRFVFTLGSTSAVGNAPRFTLPFTLLAGYAVNRDLLGQGILLDAALVNRLAGVEYFSSTAVTIRGTSTTGTLSDITSTAPWTWATGDALSVSGTVELA